MVLSAASPLAVMPDLTIALVRQDLMDDMLALGSRPSRFTYPFCLTIFSRMVSARSFGRLVANCFDLG